MCNWAEMAALNGKTQRRFYFILTFQTTHPQKIGKVTKCKKQLCLLSHNILYPTKVSMLFTTASNVLVTLAHVSHSILLLVLACNALLRVIFFYSVFSFLPCKKTFLFLWNIVITVALIGLQQHCSQVWASGLWCFFFYLKTKLMRLPCSALSLLLSTDWNDLKTALLKWLFFLWSSWTCRRTVTARMTSPTVTTLSASSLYTLSVCPTSYQIYSPPVF